MIFYPVVSGEGNQGDQFLCCFVVFCRERKRERVEPCSSVIFRDILSRNTHPNPPPFHAFFCMFSFLISRPAAKQHANLLVLSSIPISFFLSLWHVCLMKKLEESFSTPPFFRNSPLAHTKVLFHSFPSLYQSKSLTSLEKK